MSLCLTNGIDDDDDDDGDDDVVTGTVQNVAHT